MYIWNNSCSWTHDISNLKVYNQLQWRYNIAIFFLWKGGVGHFCFSIHISKISQLRPDFGFRISAKERRIDITEAYQNRAADAQSEEIGRTRLGRCIRSQKLTLTCSIYSLAMDRVTTEPLGLSRHSPPVAILSTRMIDHNRTTIHCPPTSSLFRPLFYRVVARERARRSLPSVTESSRWIFHAVSR